MRKVVVPMSVSVDGFMEGPDGDLGWHLVDDELHHHFNAQSKAMGAFLHGRVMYELMAQFWPTADSDPDATEPVAEFAGIWRDMPKYVYSRTLQHVDWNATLVRDVVADEVMALKSEPGGDLGLGGADLVRSFRRYDLVDEYRIYVHPVLVGQGRRLFEADDPSSDLELVETHTFGNGVVLLRYQRPRD